MRPLEPNPEPPIRLDAPSVALKPTAVERWLTTMLRFTSVYLMARFVYLWLTLLGVPLPGIEDFGDIASSGQVLVGTFSVLQAVAACGLWLLASWGPVVFIVLAIVESLSALGIGGPALAPVTLALIDVGLIAVYIGLSMAASRQERRRRI